MLPIHTRPTVTVAAPASQTAAIPPVLDHTLVQLFYAASDCSLYHAYLNQDNTPVVVKHTNLPLDETNKLLVVDSLDKKVERALTLDHPNLLKCLGSGELPLTSPVQTPKYATVYEYFDTTLDAFAKRKIPEDSTKLIKDVLAGLAYLHENGYTHGKLCPSEVFITTAEEGGHLAKIELDRHACEEIFHIVTGDCLHQNAKLCFVPPEQWNEGVLTSKSDIWRLGCIALQVLTGKPPEITLTDENGSRVIKDWATFQQLVCHGRSPDMPSDVTPLMRDFLGRCFEYDPAKRADAQELLHHCFLAPLPKQALVPVQEVAPPPERQLQATSLAAQFASASSLEGESSHAPLTPDMPSVSRTLPGLGYIYWPSIGSCKNNRLLRWVLADRLQRKPPFEAANLQEIRHREYRVALSDEDVARRLNAELDAAESHANDGFNDCFNLFSVKRESLQPVVPFPLEGSSIVHSINPSGIAAASCQGLRPTMEDQHIATSFVIRVGEQEKLLYLQGVFDGHGGVACAKYVADNIVKHLIERLQFNQPRMLDDRHIFNALKLAMVDLNWEFDLSQVPVEERNSGTTANVSLLIDKDIWTINVGDSRAILVSRRTDNCLPLSEDAKPDDPKYKGSIENRGGMVYGKRVDAQLAVARAFGNFSHGGHVSARPKITKYPVPPVSDDAYLMHVCDGLTDVASSLQLAGILLHSLDQGNSVEHAAVELVASAYKSGSKDNLSAVIVPMAQFSQSQ